MLKRCSLPPTGVCLAIRHRRNGLGSCEEATRRHERRGGRRANLERLSIRPALRQGGVGSPRRGSGRPCVRVGPGSRRTRRPAHPGRTATRRGDDPAASPFPLRRSATHEDRRADRARHTAVQGTTRNKGLIYFLTATSCENYSRNASRRIRLCISKALRGLRGFCINAISWAKSRATYIVKARGWSDSRSKRGWSALR